MNTGLDVQLLAPVRNVLVYSTVGQTKKEISTSAVNWLQLKAALLDEEVSTQGMKAVIGQTQVSLDLDEAILPTEGFTLFLVPSKVESGWDDEEEEEEDNWEDEDVPEDNYSREDAVEDLKESQRLTTKALRFLGDNSKPVQTRSTDPEINALDEEAQRIMRTMRR